MSHFAKFPEELPRRCILAATSAKGACRFCGAPWERVMRIPYDKNHPTYNEWKKQQDLSRDKYLGGEGRGYGCSLRMYYDEVWGQTSSASQAIGWKPACECRGQHGRTVPCVVLDPFGGSGTTGRVATELNRQGVLLDLAYSHEYGPLAKKRTTQVQRQLV